MLNFQKIQKQRIFHSPVFLGIFALVLVLFATSVWKLGTKYVTTRRERNELQSEKATLTAQAARLETKIHNLESEDGIEAQIRDQYNVVKEGEQLAVIIDKPVDSKESKRKEHVGMWQKIKSWFRK